MSVCLAKQRGVAVVTALLLTTLAVTIVASLFWQQQVQVRSMENQRLHLQTRWILRGALDWAKLILWQDGLDNRDYTAETGVWATPLAETRLDQYVERERLQNESYDATIAGQVYDAQSRYNLANLAANGAPVPAEVEVFQRLLDNLQLDVSLAQAAAQEVARSQPVPGGPVQGKSGSVQMDMLRVEDLLAVAGFTPAAIEQLREFVVVLPA
jgi:general secretion pathway protein K